LSGNGVDERISNVVAGYAEGGKSQKVDPVSEPDREFPGVDAYSGIRHGRLLSAKGIKNHR
jgi:hypothetical protein